MWRVWPKLESGIVQIFVSPGGDSLNSHAKELLPLMIRLTPDVAAVTISRSLLMFMMLIFISSHSQLDIGQYKPALALIDSLLTELKRLDDKMILTEVHLLESRVHRGTGNFPKAKVCNPSLLQFLLQYPEICGLMFFFDLIRPHSPPPAPLQTRSTAHPISKPPSISNLESFTRRTKTTRLHTHTSSRHSRT